MANTQKKKNAFWGKTHKAVSKGKFSFSGDKLNVNVQKNVSVSLKA